jgi:hypothetical protein
LVTRILIIGGYGNFGSYIARSLAGDANIVLLIGGRSLAKAKAFAAGLNARNPAIGCALDISSDISDRLGDLTPNVVIHTTGPFQSQEHSVARAAIAAGAHYLDLADAREFVATIGNLDDEAKRRSVAVISGASSVPCLTAAFIDKYRPGFGSLKSASYGITAAQATNRGLATAAAILSYVGQPFTILRKGEQSQVYGWQGFHAVRYPELGLRLFGYCDVPDLELFPARYPELENLKFVAGHELKVLHLGTWLLSWIARFGLVRSWRKYADRLLRLSFLFDPFGSDKSGFHMFLDGKDSSGQQMRVSVFIVARQVHGPNIPCIPAIILARRIALGMPPPAGARPCLDLIDLEEYLEELKGLDISLFVERGDAPS